MINLIIILISEQRQKILNFLIILWNFDCSTKSIEKIARLFRYRDRENKRGCLIYIICKEPFGFSFKFQMIWPMNCEVFHSIFLGVLLLFFMFSEVCVHIALTLSYRGQENHYKHLKVKLTATIALFFLAFPPLFKCR